MIPKECKRLAEVDFPIAEVSKHSAREKSIRHGHPSTLHLWRAQRERCRQELERQRSLSLQAVERIASVMILPHPEREAPEVKQIRQNLETFLLELGGDFCFIGRQKRLRIGNEWYHVDLVFFHRKLRCLVIIDLKIAKFTHGDLGQMQMYVNYYDREVRAPEDNPAVGLILCAEKNDAVVRYVLGKENEQIFASRYKLHLPSEEELRLELQRERRLIEERTHIEESAA